MSRKKMILPKDLTELKALLSECSQKRQKLELESATGKLKKISDLADARRKTAQIKTKIQEIETKKQKTENNEK